MKFLKIAFSVIFFLAAITAITLYVQLNTLIKTAIESYGPKITKTTVKLSSVSLQPFSGKGRIRGLVIGNPKGFKSESAFRLKDIRVALEPKSLTSNKIIAREISIDGPEITYETTPSGNNLQAIQKNVESFIPASPSGGKAAKGPEKKVEIDLFVLKNAKVHVISYLLGNRELTVPLPDIRLENIGKQSGGATMKEAFSAVMRSITRAVVQAVANSGRLLKGTVDSLNKSGQNLSRTLHSLFGR